MTHEQALDLKPGDTVYRAKLDFSAFDLEIDPSTVDCVYISKSGNDCEISILSPNFRTYADIVEPGAIHLTEADAIRCVMRETVKHIEMAGRFGLDLHERLEELTKGGES